MNWDNFRFFLSVARHGKLSRACTYLGVDHATVGRRITQLEESMGVKLFDRSPRGYALNDAGTRLMPLVERLESETMTILAEFSEREDKLSGSIRIGAPEGIATFILAQGAADLCRAHPALEIQIVALPRTFSLSKREADFAVTVSPPNTGRLNVKKIADYKLHIYAHKDYLNSIPPLENVKDLRKTMGIGYISDLIFDKELDYIPEVDPTLKPHLTSTSIHLQLQLALDAAGVCILPDFMAQRYPELQKVLAEEVTITRAFWIVVHQDLAKLKRIKTVSDYLQNSIKDTLRVIRKEE